MQDLERDDIILTVKRCLIKLQEIQSMNRKGEFIVAQEKLGGVVKVLSALGSNLEANRSGDEVSSD